MHHSLLIPFLHHLQTSRNDTNIFRETRRKRRAGNNAVIQFFRKALIGTRETLKSLHSHSSALKCLGTLIIKGLMQKTCLKYPSLFRERITSFRVYKPNQSINTPDRKCEDQRFSLGFTVPLSLLTIKAVLFPPLVDHIPAATQRECSDALISHTGQSRGQHTRTSLPVSPPCLQLLLLYSSSF